MITETVRAWDGLDIEADQNSETTVWVDPQYWALARDRNLCVAHLEVLKVSGSPDAISVVAQDSSGRIFVDVPLTGNTRTTKGTLRTVIKDFGANLKIGVRLDAGAGGAASATVALEYTLKAL